MGTSRAPTRHLRARSNQHEHHVKDEETHGFDAVCHGDRIMKNATAQDEKKRTIPVTTSVHDEGGLRTRVITGPLG